MAHTEAHDIIKRVEQHCGKKIDDRRLRFHIIANLEREIDKRVALESRIRAVLDGAHTYDDVTHKPIRRSANG